MTETPRQFPPIGHKAAAACGMVLVASLAWYFSPLRVVQEPLPAFSGAAAAGEQAAPVRSQAPGPEAAVVIQGDYKFKSLVTHSLRLIWLADKEDFQFIKQYLRVIRNENKTEFYLESGSPVIALSGAQSGRSLTWCAGLIAHQAFHAHLKLGSSKKRGVRPPLPGQKDERSFEVNPLAINYTSLGEIFREEARASDFQARVLKKIGAPSGELARLARRSPRDFSVSHDGNYSIKP